MPNGPRYLQAEVNALTVTTRVEITLDGRKPLDVVVEVKHPVDAHHRDILAAANSAVAKMLDGSTHSSEGRAA